MACHCSIDLLRCCSCWWSYGIQRVMMAIQFIQWFLCLSTVWLRGLQRISHLCIWKSSWWAENDRLGKVHREICCICLPSCQSSCKCAPDNRWLYHLLVHQQYFVHRSFFLVSNISSMSRDSRQAPRSHYYMKSGTICVKLKSFNCRTRIQNGVLRAFVTLGGFCANKSLKKYSLV